MFKGWVIILLNVSLSHKRILSIFTERWCKIKYTLWAFTELKRSAKAVFFLTICSDASFPKLADRKHPSLAACVFFCSTTTGHWKISCGGSLLCVQFFFYVYWHFAAGDSNASNMGYTCKSTLSRTTCYLSVFYTLMGLLHLPQGWIHSAVVVVM